MGEKIKYELDPDVQVGAGTEDDPALPLNSVELAVHQRLVRIEAGQSYETDDPGEIAALDQQWGIRRAKRAAAKPPKADGGEQA